MKLPFLSKSESENNTHQEEDRHFFFSNDDAVTSEIASLSTGLGVTPKKLFLHVFLFVTTIITTTITGAIFPYILQEADFSDILHLVTTSPIPIINGLLFSFTLLVILGTHELGHYIACRYYGVNATLPYFIPVPPPLGVGTLGAFIKIQSPIYNKKALFDIGISGPLAGFIFAIPAAIVGIYYGHPVVSALSINFNNPLLFTLISKALGIHSELAWNPIWFGCWIGMLATALNLLPVGQLDGGHVVYALFGKRGHSVVALTITILQAVVAYIAYVKFNWSGSFVYLIMLVVLFIKRHPQVLDEEEPIGFWRKFLGFVALLVFLLCFMPVPLRIN